MSVATKNPFALLDEDASSSPAPASKGQTSAAPAASTPSRGNQRGRGGPASRGGRYYQRGGANAGTQKEITAQEEPPVGSESTRRKYDGDRGRGRGRGRGGPRGRGRTFDKHSATGKTDSDKKVHQSWGGDEGNAELKAEQAAASDAANEANATTNDWGAEATAGDWGAPAPSGEEAAPTDGDKPESRRRDREEEDDNTLTLEEYLAQRKESSAIPTKLEARKVDDQAWEGASLIKKGEEEEYFAAKTKTNTKPRAEKKEKVFIEIEARFERPARGGRGRGGDRGRGERGGRGRGGRGRGGANGIAASVDMDDQTAFPSLS